LGPDELVPKWTQDGNSLGEIAKIMMEHGLIIIYIIYFRSDLTNSLYDGIENIIFIYKSEISFSYTIVILFSFSCKLSYITLTLMVNLFFKKS